MGESRSALFLTWRLHGTLPPDHVQPRQLAGGRQFASIDRLLDRRVAGPDWLGQPEIAEIVAGTLQSHARVHGHFELHAWVVMPNHVHALLTPAEGAARMLGRWKEAAGRLALQTLGLAGQPFWHRDPLFHAVETPGQFLRITHYIEANPVRAGLAAAVGEYAWSSAATR
jgi:REP element-mobilizing transposase RayT